MKRSIDMAAFIGVLVCLSLLGGCGGQTAVDPEAGAGRSSPSSEAQLRLMVRVLDGTVGQAAYLEGGNFQVVRGYGLVVGLAGNGSSECPTVVRDRLVTEMGRMGVGDARTGTQAVSPNRLINDPDTAVVVVSALIPPGAPAGSPLDVAVTALPKSQTLSLDGGLLYMTHLRAFSTASGAVRESRILARAEGAVFVNPFAADRNPAATSRLRAGRVIGGGVSTKARQIRLVLRQPDYAMARVLQDAINDHFGSRPLVARAQNPSYLDIKVPRRYRYDYEGFLRRLTHLYVRKGGGIEDRKARQLAEDILLDDAPGDDISMIWEAMGRQVLPIIHSLYVSTNREVAYYAARAGARLGDMPAIDVLAAVALRDGPHRMEAIAELGSTANVNAADTLRALLSNDDAMIRVAAYEAATAGGLGCGVRRYEVNGDFSLDVVPSSSGFLIYATRSGRPRVALFGEGMQVARPVFFNAPGDLVTINAASVTSDLQVYRRVGAERRLSDALTISPEVQSLVMAMGTPPEQNADGTFQGLGLTYSQVVGVLYRLCEDVSGKKVPAFFVLQKPDATDRMSAGRLPVGRQDTAR